MYTRQSFCRAMPHGSAIDGNGFFAMRLTNDKGFNVRLAL
jgi:hypothetical protein